MDTAPHDRAFAEMAERISAAKRQEGIGKDVGVPEAGMLADVRRVWGPTDTGAVGRVRAAEPQ